MNSMQSNWAELKSKIRTQWNKLTDKDVDSFEGDTDRIPSSLQSRYGYSKDRADREYSEWKRTLGTGDDVDAHGGDRLN